MEYEPTYEEQLHKELTLLITKELLQYGMKNNVVHNQYGGNTSMNSFGQFAKDNPKLLADMIMDGDLWKYPVCDQGTKTSMSAS